MTDPATRFREAISLHRAGQVERAAAIYQQMLAENPGHGPLHDLLGTAQMQMGRPQDGVMHLREALRIMGPQPQVLSHLGTALQAAGRLEEALGCFDQAIHIQPGFAEAQFNRANVLIAQGRKEEALAALDKTLALAQQFIPALYNRATLQADMGHDEEAIADYTRLLSLNPRMTNALLNRAQILQRVGQTEAALADYEAVLLLAPDTPEALARSGALLLLQDRPAEAEPRLSHALAQAPADKDSLNNRGNARIALNQPLAALADFEAALALDPDFVAAHSNRGNALTRLGRFNDALASFDAALALQPDYADGWANKALALRGQGNLEAALTALDQALTSEPDHADARFSKAHILLLQGRLKEGFALYECRWQRAQFRRIAWQRPEPMWLGENLTGKRLLIRAEQGYGDVIMMCRYAPLVAARGGNVVLAVPPALTELMRTLMDVTVIADTDAPGPIDFHIPVVSLPYVFGTDTDSIPAATPYLMADPARRAALRQALGEQSRPRIGLAISGDTRHINDANRSVPLAMLAPLLELPCDFYLVQQGLRPEDCTEAAQYPNLHQPSLDDFADTAALIAEMDLTISVDSAPAHVAGAIGAPVWIVLPFSPDWRWMVRRDDSPWYPTARLFRQPQINDWNGVISAVCRALQA